MTTPPTTSTQNATASELSDLILSWADQRHRSILPDKRSATWTTKELRDSFRANLERNLLAAVATTRRVAFVAQLINAFSASGSSKAMAVVSSRNLNAHEEGRDTFQSLRVEVAQLLNEWCGPPLRDIETGRAADLIVKSLRQALAQEAQRAPTSGATPEEVLYHYMTRRGPQRQYEARTFLAFLGVVVLAVVLFVLIEPESWVNPATGLFVLLAYLTLVATCLIHYVVSARPQ